MFGWEVTCDACLVLSPVNDVRREPGKDIIGACKIRQYAGLVSVITMFIGDNGVHEIHSFPHVMKITASKCRPSGPACHLPLEGAIYDLMRVLF